MHARRPTHHSRAITRRPPRALRRAAAAAALPLAIVVAAVAIAAEGPGGGVRPAATTIRAAGAVTMTNSKAPGAVLTAGGMKPGDSIQGTVTITNSGDPAAYALASSHLLDSSTPALSGQLQLVVEDITGAPVQVYSGAFGAMPAKALGSFASGEARTYRFTVTLPHSAGNPYQGASSSIQLDWTASGSSSGGGDTGGGGNPGGGQNTGGGGSTGAAGNTGGGTSSVGGAGGTTGGHSSALKLKFSKKQKAKDGVTVSATCLVNCTATFSGNVSVPGASRSYPLSKVTKSLRAGRATSIKLKFSSKAKKAIQKALAKHKKVTATVQTTVRGSGASSQRVNITLTR